MRRLFGPCAALAILAGIGASAHAQLVTFDDLPEPDVVENGYYGLNWSNWGTMAPASTSYANTGYGVGTISGPIIVFNSGANIATISTTAADGFSLTSAYFTAAFDIQQSVFVDAWQTDGTEVAALIFTNDQSPVFHIFDWTHIARATFSASNTGFFAMDNLTLAPPPPPPPIVPEPASWALMVGGFGLVGGALRTARRSVRFA